jgi:hypothetical protein
MGDLYGGAALLLPLSRDLGGSRRGAEQKPVEENTRRFQTEGSSKFF